MEAPAPAPWPALGVLLIRDGLVSRAELEAALADQGDGRDRRVSGQRLGEALVERGVVTSAQVARLVAEQHELPYVDLDESDSIGPVATRLPEDLARRCAALPVRVFPDGSLLVAVADPGRLACLDDIRRVLGVRVRWAVAAPDAIAASIDAAVQMTLLQAQASAAALEATDEIGVTDPPEIAVPADPDVPDSPLVVADSQRRPVLGSLLLRDGLVSEEELDAALAQQRLSSTRRLGEILVARGSLSEADVSRALAEQHELPFVELSGYDIDPAAAGLLPVELVRRHSALPVSYLADGSVLVVVADPTSSIHDDELRADLGVSVQYAVAAAREIETAIASAFAPQPLSSPEPERPTVALVPALPELGPALPEDEAQAETEADEEQDSSADVLATIGHALSLGATAIHFVPGSSGVVITARIDGNLMELTSLPDDDRITQELGRILGIDITHTTRPLHRNGLPISFEEDSTEMEVAVLPTTRGPRVTLRVVDEQPPLPSLSDLVPDTSQREAIQNALEGPRGLLVVCGTPGSALSATLYAALEELDTSELNVLTIEDPVERRLEGISQVEVDPAAGITVASALRAVQASDPDVVAVGELVDDETARAAVLGASDTVVLATIAAPSASAGLRRLCELGGDAAPVSASSTGVVAQQVVRKTCLACREPYYATVDEVFELGLPPEDSGRRLLGRGRGCDECADSGYQGHTNLIEVLPLTDEVRALAADGASAAEIECAAEAAGMRTLREQAIALCLEGVITTAEVRAVVNRPSRRWQS